VAGFGQLAAQLGVGDRGDPVASVHGVLATGPAEWLLVFDNAPDRDSVAPFVPPAGSGKVLVTSRNQIWPPGQALDVPVLGPQAAADFFVSRTGDLDRRAALQLADELGGLPLALEQAAAYIQASGGSLADYLESFLRRRADLLDRGKPIGYSATVATTWRLAFEDVQQTAPGAAGLLRLLAFCAPEAIPLRLLLQPRPGLAEQLAPEVAPVLVPLLEDELAVADAVAALRRYSLISPPADGTVSVHRLVQAVTVGQMPAELAGQWRQAAAIVIEAAIPGDTNLPATWPACAALLPHAQAALNPTSEGIWQIARYLGHSGSYPAARDLFQAIADARRGDDDYGAEHPDTLRARANLARWTGDAGDPVAARDELATLLSVEEGALGPEDPNTLITRHILARWTGMAGDAAAARDLLAALLPVRERVLGPEHPNTLATRHVLAHWTGMAGDAAAARDLLAALLPLRERVLGPEHPKTLACRARLAYWDERGEPGSGRA
jgi:Tetratricopeptide repeat